VDRELLLLSPFVMIASIDRIVGMALTRRMYGEWRTSSERLCQCDST